jgi:hypothetical protein
MTTKNLAIDLITAISGMQMREGMKLDVIEEYQECFNGKAWPFNEPLVVFSDGESYWLADGFHRFEAAKRAKRGSVQCEIRTGSVHDAEDYAAGANGRHGLRRTNADKRKAVLWALNCDRHCNKSLRDIADLCLVGKSLVGSIKHELSLKDSGVDSGQVSLKDSQKPAGTVKTESIENENDFTPPDETEYEYIEKDENEPLEDGEIDCGLVDEPEIKTGFCKCQICGGTGQVERGQFDSKFDEVWGIVRAAGKKTRIADSGKQNSKKAYEKAIKAISRDGIEDDTGEMVTVSDPHGFFKMRIQLFVSSVVGQGEFCPQFTTLVSREFWNQDDERWNEGNSKDLFVDSVGGVY